MKNRIINTVKILSGILLLGLVIILFLKSDYHFPFEKEDYLALKQEVRKAEKLPDEFYDTYNDIKPMKNGNAYLMSKILNRNNSECPCMYVANLSRMKFTSKSSINEIILGWKLEKQFTQRECLNYVVQEFDYVYGQVGIKNAAKFYFEKEINQLNTKEYQTLIVMLQNPSIYNPKRYPDQLEAKLNQL